MREGEEGRFWRKEEARCGRGVEVKCIGCGNSFEGRCWWENKGDFTGRKKVGAGGLLELDSGLRVRRLLRGVSKLGA